MRIPKMSDLATMNECRKVGRALQSYLDGQADEMTTRRVSKHLEACRRCGLEVRVYEALKQALTRRATELDPDAVERVTSFGRTLLETPPDEQNGSTSG